MYSLLRPSSLKGSKTKLHDEIHLWLNRAPGAVDAVLNEILPRQDADKRVKEWSHGQAYSYGGFNDYEYIMHNLVKTEYNIQREQPFYNGNGYLVARPDAIIFFKVIYLMHRVEYREDKTIADEERPREYSFTWKILLEFDPRLDSASGLIGQLKAYAHEIQKRDKDYSLENGRLRMGIITFNWNDDYDELFASENIKIIRAWPRKEAQLEDSTLLQYGRMDNYLDK